MRLWIRARNVLVFAVATGALLPGAANARFSAPETISPPNLRTWTTDIAVDSRGNALAVWDTGLSTSSVVQARFRSRKGAWGPVLTLSEPGESSGGPRVAFDAHDNAVVAWSSSEPVPGDPYAVTSRVRAAFRPVGGSFGPSQVVRDEVGEVFLNVYDVVGNEGAVLAWTSRQVGDEIPTVEVATRPPGGSFGAHVSMGLGDFPEVAIDRQDNAIAGWVGSEFGPVRYAGKPAGGGFGPSTFLHEGPVLGGLAIDRHGNALVTVGDFDDRLVMFFRPAGESFEPGQIVEGAGGDEATFDDRGNAVLAWRDAFSRGRVKAMTRRSDGTLTTPETLSGPAGEIRSVVADAGRGAVVAWDRAERTGPLTRATRQVEAAFSTKPAKGAFTSAEVVSDPTAEAFDPDVALDRQGRALAVWIRGDVYDYTQPRSVQFAEGRR
jgi:hypothetical protein